jgi:hypothetical protein
MDLIQEIALKEGFMLNVDIAKEETFSDNEVYRLYDNHKQALICLDDTLLQSTIDQLTKINETRFICLDKALNLDINYQLRQTLGDNL